MWCHQEAICTSFWIVPYGVTTSWETVDSKIIWWGLLIVHACFKVWSILIVHACFKVWSILIVHACFKVWSMHSASTLAILCWELVKATYLYKKGMLLVGSLLVRGFVMLMSPIKIKTSILPLRMAAYQRLLQSNGMPSINSWCFYGHTSAQHTCFQSLPSHFYNFCHAIFIILYKLIYISYPLTPSA